MEKKKERESRFQSCGNIEKTSRIRCTFASLTPYVDFCYNFPTNPQRLGHGAGGGCLVGGLGVGSYPLSYTLFYACTTPCHLIWLLLFLAFFANRLCHHTLAFYNINFHLFSFVFLAVFIYIYLFFCFFRHIYAAFAVVASACNALM